jgi:hypothetical protein
MVKIGVITPFSNEYPFMASDFVDGLKLVFEKNNKVELIHVETDRGIPKEVSPLFRQLIVNKRVDLLVAFLDPTTIASVNELVKQTETPVVFCNMGVRLPLPVAETSPFVFHNTMRMWESCWLAGKTAARLLGQNYGVLASFFDSGFPLVYAQSKGAEEAGGKPAFFAITHKDNLEQELAQASNLSGQFSTDYYFVSYYGKERSAILRWMEDQGYNSDKVWGTPAIQSDSEKISTVTSWHSNLDLPSNVEFVSSFRALKNGQDANGFNMLGYETGLMVSEAMNGAEERFDKSSFLQNLKTLKFMGPRGETVMNPRTQSTQSNHFLLQSGFLNEKEALTGLQYPQEQIEAEVMANLPVNYVGWQNTYLCK